jgi:hypothetical protein
LAGINICYPDELHPPGPGQEEEGGQGGQGEGGQQVTDEDLCILSIRTMR